MGGQTYERNQNRCTHRAGSHRKLSGISFKIRAGIQQPADRANIKCIVPKDMVYDMWHKGKEVGVDTPLNEFFYHGIRVLEEKNEGVI